MKKRRTPCENVPIAGLRPDRVGRLGVPIPDEESVLEEFRWREIQQY